MRPTNRSKIGSQIWTTARFIKINRTNRSKIRTKTIKNWAKMIWRLVSKSRTWCSEGSLRPWIVDHRFSGSQLWKTKNILYLNQLVPIWKQTEMHSKLGVPWSHRTKQHTCLTRKLVHSLMEQIRMVDSCKKKLLFAKNSPMVIWMNCKILMRLNYKKWPQCHQPLRFPPNHCPNWANQPENQS